MVPLRLLVDNEPPAWVRAVLEVLAGRDLAAVAGWLSGRRSYPAFLARTYSRILCANENGKTP